MEWSLYTDLYQLTMAQAYLDAGKTHQQAVFTMNFRDYPFHGGYAIACGMVQVMDIIDEYGFTDDQIDYLRALDAPGGGKLFHEDFLEMLSAMQLEIDIDGVSEGEVVFPNEPIFRVKGPIIQCQLLETTLLNCINFQTLVATKASRICRAAAGKPVVEFGLRRAQGTGALWASRAAVVGGCVGTSNVLAGKMFDIPVSGTHAHSWVMSFDDELEAFRAYADAFPKNCSLLIDTYDVEKGIDNAIIVAKEMAQKGERLNAVRIDSGDLSWLAKRARKKLDEAGLYDVGIMLTNDLDEHTISSILDEGAPVDMWGVGTKLASSYDQPALGGIYKLSAVSDDGAETWEDRIKISESVAKMSLPGVLDVRRYHDADGKLAGDMVFDVNRGVGEGEVIVDPHDTLRRKTLKGLGYRPLFIPLVENGHSVASAHCSAMEARERAIEGLARLDETQLRILNPHTYPVGFEQDFYDHRNSLVSTLRTPDEP